MKKHEKLTFPAMFRQAVDEHSDAGALSFVGEKPLTYRQVLESVESVMRYLEDLGIVPGDRVALLGANMPNWGIAYFGITFMGAIAVPLLPDFTPGEIMNILDHSGTKAVFVSANLILKLEDPDPGPPRMLIRMEDFGLIGEDKDLPAYRSGETPSNTYAVNEDNLAAIIYTSGTTGVSKGVMLTHRNICSNVEACRTLHTVGEKDRFLSILPLSHTLENTVGFLVPVMNGACVYYLRKPPSPSVLMPALKEVRPTIMLSVPMVIEKIYFQKIWPSLTGRKILRMLMRTAVFRKILYQAAGRKLQSTFGGKLEFFGIGGAKLNTRVEKFLSEAGFPYAIGYGLTETSPLLAGAVPGKTRIGSTGHVIEDVELKIHDPNPQTGEGEIWARGPNVMKGYYLEPELTREVLTDDGWFRTGDLGILDGDGRLFIMGRLKNMIVGSSGENIYPEEIEFVINDFRHVVESLVVEKKGKLVALVHINLEEIEQAYQHLKEEVSHFMEEKTKEILHELKTYVNARVNKFSRIHSVVLQKDPFQKTATKKIKRYLYS
jgi:long-chain acyl-CoA synthetase